MPGPLVATFESLATPFFKMSGLELCLGELLPKISVGPVIKIRVTIKVMALSN